MTQWTLSGTSLSSQTFTPVQVPTQCYSQPVNAAQQGTTTTIDVSDSRIPQVIDNGGILYFSLTSAYNWGCASGTNDNVDWFELDSINQSVFVDGSFGTPCLYYFMPGMQPLGDLDLAFAYEYSGATTFPDSAIITTDPSGNPFSNLITQTSNGDYTLSTGNGGRWGDYTACLLDPTNADEVWSVGEYTTSTDTWGTWIDQFSG